MSSESHGPDDGGEAPARQETAYRLTRFARGGG
jgi:hypothetical protein